MNLEKIQLSFTEKFTSEPDVLVIAPGRVNLIGEHTDYNNGFVFPVAIDRYIAIAAKKRADRKIILHSQDFNNTVEFSLNAIQRSSGEESWSNYPKGVAHFLQEAGYQIAGCEAVITGDIPIAAGLSSSAAIEVASALMFLQLSDLDFDKPALERSEGTEIALLCQRAENQFVGVNCGIMDQFISMMGKKDHALFLDCRSLDYQLAPLNFDNVKIVVCNTKVKRELSSSEYNKRREECEHGVNILKRWLPNIRALRDVSVEDFKKYEDKLPKLTQKRCGYVIEENARVIESVNALKTGSLTRFGELMKASHAGLKDKYEVSSEELDAMVKIALSVEGVIGARMTGAGFGGCTVNIVYEDAVKKLTETIESKYPQLTGIQPEIYVCNVESGAEVLVSQVLAANVGTYSSKHP